MLFLLSGCAAGVVITEEIAEKVIEEVAEDVVKYEKHKHTTKTQVTQ